MHSLGKGQIFRSGQRHARGRDAFNRRIVCQIGKQHRSVNRAGAPEFLYKELGFLKRDADGGKDNREVGCAVQHLSLTRNLRGKLCMRKTGTGEHRQLLPANQRIQTINRRYARLNEFVRVVARCRIHRQSIDVAVFLRENIRTAVNRLTHTVKDTSQHIAADGKLKRMPQKANLRLRQIDAGGGFIQLNNGGISVDLQHLGAAN